MKWIGASMMFRLSDSTHLACLPLLLLFTLFTYVIGFAYFPGTKAANHPIRIHHSCMRLTIHIHGQIYTTIIIIYYCLWKMFLFWHWLPLDWSIFLFTRCRMNNGAAFSLSSISRSVCSQLDKKSVHRLFEISRARWFEAVFVVKIPDSWMNGRKSY